MSFAYPSTLIMLILIIPLTMIYSRRFSRLSVSLSTRSTPKHPTSRLVTWLRWFCEHAGWGCTVLALICLIIALARPRIENHHTEQHKEGLDIYLVIDTSLSMSEQDLTVNGQPVDRLTAVKRVVKEFIAARVHDRIGLVIFGSTAYAQAPLTSDHEVLNQFFDEISIGMAGENTAIGDAIGVASNRFMSVESPTKIMILLTDGAHSAGSISPEQAAQAAAGLGIKIYTIGVVGSARHGFGFQLAIPSFNTDILKYIAETTSGQFYTADSTAALTEIYQTINKLETTPSPESTHLLYHDLYRPFLWGSIGWIIGLWLLGLVAWRKWP